MDINELNKMNLTAQFSKLISQTNFMGAEGEGFASILAQNTTEMTETSKPAEKVEEKVSEKPQNEPKEKTETKDKAQKEEKTQPEEDVEKSEIEEDKSDLPEKDEENKEETKASSQETILPLQVACLEGTTPAEAVTTESDIVPSLEELPKGILSENMQIIDKDGNILALSDISAEELSAQDSFKLINPQTMQEAEVSGEQLAQIISKLFTATSEAAPVEAAAILPEIETPAAEMISSTKKTQNNADNLTVENAVEEISDKISETAISDALDVEEKLAGQQVKIDLTVKEEKNSYFATKELVKDRVLLQETVENMDSQSVSGATKNSSQPISNGNNGQNNVNSLNLMQQTSSAVQDAKTNVQTQAVAEVKQVSASGSTSQAVVSGAEFLASAKAENAGKSNQTTLNEVYRGMSKEAVEQVKVNITKSAVKGVDTIEVRLKPEELGNIEIKMQIKDGKLQAHIISSRPETMEALQRDAQVLEKAFNDAGFQTDGNSLSFSFRNDGNQAQEQGTQLRNFIGKVFEQEANSDVMTAEAANQNWSAENGLNIRV